MSIKSANTVTWALRIIASLILLQTLFFKFTAAEESVYIFSAIGMEPWGRIGTGVLELMSSALILIPATTLFGSLLAIGIMTGAVFFHLTKLGVSVQNDGGQLFIYAVIVLSCSVALVVISRKRLIALLRKQ